MLFMYCVLRIAYRENNLQIQNWNAHLKWKCSTSAKGKTLPIHHSQSKSILHRKRSKGNTTRAIAQLIKNSSHRKDRIG